LNATEGSKAEAHRFDGLVTRQRDWCTKMSVMLPLIAAQTTMDETLDGTNAITQLHTLCI
jgi:hypothetical protein